jgi:AcrR family transcriptional regulator
MSVSRAADTYHHGNLPTALRRAAAEVIQEGGLSSFSLREVARRAGVSHTAPAHHFGDSRGLLTSLAAEGFEQLHSALVDAAAGHDDPVDRLVALGATYVQFARSHGGHCEVMFRLDFVDPDDPDLMACGLTAYKVLEDTVAAVIDTHGSDVDLDTATWLCWSALQGLVVLEPKLNRIAGLRAESDTFSTEDLVTRFTELIAAGLGATEASQ